MLVNELTELAKLPPAHGAAWADAAHDQKIRADIESECYNLRTALYRAVRRGEKSFVYYVSDNNPWPGYLPALRAGVVEYAKREGVLNTVHDNPNSGEFALTCAGW